MSLLSQDIAVGQPPFALTPDQIATVLDLVCQGAESARNELTPGILEVRTTVLVRKAMRRIKKLLSLTNLEIRGEHELEDMSTSDAAILGRIDITLKFLHQFGDEDAYVAVECKRVGAGLAQLNGRYITQGIDRFVRGQYANGHEWGFMLGYVLVLPVQEVVSSIDQRIRTTYGDEAHLAANTPHPSALAVLEGVLKRNSGEEIHLKHIFVDMTPAAEKNSMSEELQDS